MGISVGSKISTYFQTETKAASLAVFRVLFGMLMMVSIIRFWYNGWIEKLYLLPRFHFHYSGFEFVQVPGIYTYGLFILCGISAFMVGIGYKYRIAIILFFLSFTYMELMDKTTYLNHYYFVSVVSFILIWLPAHCSYSVDAYKNDRLRAEYIRSWQADILKLALAIVYIYAGLAKLNYDWLFNAMPLSIWLPTKFEVPFLGAWMHERWMHYLFSWAGAIYDLCIVFFLLWGRTRVIAYIAVIVFHVLTRVLFPIGMFPYIMIASTLVFFNAGFHERLIEGGMKLMKIDPSIFRNSKMYSFARTDQIGTWVLGVCMAVQLLLPLRYLMHSDNVFWTERGYRFAWRVMLMEKTGYANFKIVNQKTGKRFYVRNSDFLTAIQEKQMSTQADFILEYGQYLGTHFASQGHENVGVYVESYASLNGRKHQVYIDPEVDLMNTTYSQLCQSHIKHLE